MLCGFENFVLCDASSSRLPILHASSGFEKMYGHSERSFLDMMEVGRQESLYEVAELGTVEIDDAMDFLASEVKNYTRCGVMQEPVEHPLLFINQKSCGEFFTCEMQIVQKHHPSLGWSYVVAAHRDVTSALPVSEVLKAAQCATSYRMLCAQWAQRQKNGAQSLLNSDQDFDQMVHGAWRDRISKKLVDENAKLQPRSAEVETLASVSTACSMSSLVRKNDVRAEDGGTQRSTTWSAIGQPCFHLGALARATTEDALKRTESTERSDSEDRDRNLFLDLEEPDCTEELPEAICCSLLSSLPFSFFILDPRHEELPIVLASHKFACDTMVGDCLLRSFDSLFLNAKSAPRSTPEDLTAFWAASRKGEFLEERFLGGAASFGEVQLEADLQNKSGELVPCIITLKQVELDDAYFVAGVSHSAVRPGAQQQNDINLDEAIQVMASEFFFSAPMRRQTATDH